MTENATQTISDLLKECRTFEPSAEFLQQSKMTDKKVYQEAENDYLKYWEGWANQLQWERKWKTTLEWKAPYAKWFVEGELNAASNCLDRHVFGVNARRNKAALIWEGEPGEQKTYTYWDLYRETCKFANVLKNLGLRKGDRIAFYMPNVPELVIACLASARIGAIHSVVFGGFSAESLKDRILDAAAKMVITADYGWRRGKKIELKKAVDQAIQTCACIESVIVFKRDAHLPKEMETCEMKVGRDVWWHEAIEGADSKCPPETMNSEDPLFILYTSGTTGKPKGIVHSTGGYLTGVYATTQVVFDLKETDVFWCTADIGWITGHSYVIYGPLSNGATVVMYEGSPDWPDKDRFWKLIEKYGVTIFYTAPTAIRSFMKWGVEWTQKADLSTLRLLGSVGEPINPEAWMWYYKYIGRERCPVVDTWWQTETGAIMITSLPGICKMKPGSAALAFPGIFADVLNDEGDSIQVGGGYAAITKPWPSMLRTIWGDDARYQQQYWSKWAGKDIYFPGDGVKRDEDGYFWFLGRVDDVMNIAGHRIGTAEVESALVDHPDVAESAVVGRTHDIKGTAIVAFVTLKEGVQGDENLLKVLKQHVVTKIGAIARPEEIIFSADLPKTRSGKIMRRLLKDIAEGRALGDTTTLADPAVVQNLKQQYESIEG